MVSNQKAFIDYIQLQKKYSLHTVLAYGKDIQEFKDFIVKEFDENDLNKVSYSLIRSWIVSLSNKEITNSTINRKISSLKAYYRFLLRIKQIEVSPLIKHKALKSQKKIQIPFSEKELNLVLNEIEFKEDFEGVRDKLIIELFYSTGIRRAELIDLKITNVDIKTNLIKVNGKRDKQRLIPVLQITASLINKYLMKRNDLKAVTDLDHLLISKKGVKLNNSFVYRLINHYFSNVSEKVKKSPHMLRHTFATHMLNNGADINSIKELLGHSSLASTQVYTQNSLAELKKVYSKAHPRIKK